MMHGAINLSFVTKDSAHSTLRICYKQNYMEEIVNKKFLGLDIHSHINCKNRIERMIPKLSGAFYADRLMVRISNTLKSM